jgi:hypothetical protein
MHKEIANKLEHDMWDCPVINKYKKATKLQEYRNICNTILDTEIFEKVYIFQISKKDKE